MDKADDTQQQHLKDDLRRAHRGQWKPDWTWQRARQIVDEGLPMSRRLDDEWVGYARDVLRAHRSGGREGIEHLRCKYPHLIQAFEIYESGGRLKSLVEASLLSEADAQCISNFFGMPEITLAVYERIFFSVRSVLFAAGTLSACALRPAANAALNSGDEDATLKLIAYYCGWEALVQYICLGTIPDEPDHGVEGLIRAEVVKRALGSVVRRPFDGAPDRRALEDYVELMRAENLAGSSQASQQRFEEEVAWKIMGSNKFYKLSDRGTTFKDGHELRGVDQIRACKPKDGTGDEERE